MGSLNLGTPLPSFIRRSRSEDTVSPSLHEGALPDRRMPRSTMLDGGIWGERTGARGMILHGRQKRKATPSASRLCEDALTRRTVASRIEASITHYLVLIEAQLPLELRSQPSTSPIATDTLPTGRHRWEGKGLLALLLSALAIRLWLLPAPPFWGDMEFFGTWANALLTTPFADFYTRGSPDCDYLPGFLYLLALIASLQSALAHAVPTPENLVPWIKSTAIGADMVLGVAAFLLCRREAGPRRSLLAAALVLFNPGVVYVGAVWGQVDSLGVAISLLALATLIWDRPFFAAFLAAVAFAVKPQYSVLLTVGTLVYLREEIRQLRTNNQGKVWTVRAVRLLRRVVQPVLVFLGVLQAVLLPFSTSIWPFPGTEWTLMQRLSLAAERYPWTSVNAFNLWGTQVAGMWEPDATRGWLSLSYQSWGILLLAAVVLSILLLVWVKGNSTTAVLWATFVVAFAFFVLPTRVHERYLFAAIPALAVTTVLRPLAIPLYLGLSALFMANLWYAAVFSLQDPQTGPMAAPDFVAVASTFSVLLLAASLAALIWVVATDRLGEAPRRALVLQALQRLNRAVPVRVSVLMALLAVAFVAGVLAGGIIESDRLPGGQVHRVTIRASRLWQDAGVEVVEGQQILIVSRGDWGNQHGGERYGPEGGRRIDGATILPTAPVGVLLGRTGDSEPFVVGRAAVVEVTSSGPLQLVMNDWTDDRHDSWGRVDVDIVVLK